MLKQPLLQIRQTNLFQLIIFDSFLRGALLVLWLVLAGLFFRDRGRSAAARTGLLLMLGLCCQVFESMPSLRTVLPLPWQAILAGIATGNCVLAWLWFSSLFDDEFRWRAWYFPLWLGVAALALANFPLGLVWNFPAASWTHFLQRLAPVFFAGWSLLVVLRQSELDLVLARRSLRQAIVWGSLGYILVTAGSRLWLGVGALPPSFALLDSALLLLVTGLSFWLVVREANLFRDLLPPVEVYSGSDTEQKLSKVDPVQEEAASLSSQDLARLPELEAWMHIERAYRRPEFQVSDLASALNLPEYRTRKLIHQGLGFRNFNVFVNHYRIAEVKQRLHDPQYRDQSILTLALEAGFGSLAPFNKAFRAEIGTTPSEYRRIGPTNPIKAD